MHLTLSYVAENPSTLTKAMPIASGEEIVLRPLDASNLQGLTVFLERLSPETRHFCIYPGYDRTAAKEFCDAINRYDKLRLVLDEPSSGKIIGLLEYSFDIPEGDFKRFANYAVQLNAATDCRFGPCLSDDYQNKGVGSVIFPYVVDVARQFGKERLILWGGVLSDNKRAIRYYAKNGFKLLGSFRNRDGVETLDMMLNL